MYLYKSLLPTHHEFAEICLSLKLQKSGSKCCSCCKVETTGMADPVPIVRSPPAVNGCPKKTYQVAIRRSVRCFFSVFWPCKKKIIHQTLANIGGKSRREMLGQSTEPHEVLGSLKCVFILRCFRMHEVIHMRLLICHLQLVYLWQPGDSKANINSRAYSLSLSLGYSWKPLVVLCILNIHVDSQLSPVNGLING